MARGPGSLPCCLWKKDGRQQPGCDQDGQHCWVPARNASGSRPCSSGWPPSCPQPQLTSLLPSLACSPSRGGPALSKAIHPPPCESAMGTAALVRAPQGDRQWDVCTEKALLQRLVHMTIREADKIQDLWGCWTHKG